MLPSHFAFDDRRTSLLGWRIYRAPAKVNLFLEVGQRQADGYHAIETVMAPLSLADQLAVVSTEDPAIELQLETQGRGGEHQGLPPASENLIIRILKAFQTAAGVKAGMRVRLWKRIPLQAGLGGASSDAASALRAANQLWQTGWSPSRLAAWSAEFGSDIPFFLQSGWAICRGRGEIVQPLENGWRCPVLVVAPPIGFATADIYRRHQPVAEMQSGEPITAAITARKIPLTGQRMFNRLQAAASRCSEWIERLSRLFGQLPALGHQMTGSGSCYFGLFATAASAHWSAAKLKQELADCRVIECETRPELIC